MNTKLTRADWKRSKEDNILLIINNKMQIKMATKVIELCNEELDKFPKPEAPNLKQERKV